MRETKKNVDKVFRFGETEFKSIMLIEIPCYVGKRYEKIYIRTHIIKGSVPWLIGRETMSNLKMVINVEKNSIRCEAIGGLEMKVRKDDKGHMRLRLIRKLEKEEIWVGNLGGNIKERERKVRKLHLQFGHPGWERLYKLIEESKKEGEDNNIEEMRETKRIVKEASENCEICLRYKKTPARPIVGMSWARKFNQIVAVDLGQLEGKTFLLMVDMASKYCQAGWVESKKPEEIMEVLLEKWIGVFGAPKELLSDNGGEFQNEKVRILLEKFNIKMRSTAAESPWSNGVCEKWVGLIKDTLRKLKKEGDINHKVSLNWAVAAKNSLYDNRGFSPNQIVFGKNPTLPNLMREDVLIPMMEEGNEERMVKENLVAMHKAREIHVQQEAEEKIRRALKGQIRDHKIEDASLGDEVLYKRAGEKEWRGPAKVIGVDGKTVMVKHGGSIREIARVHITRVQGIQKASNEREKKDCEKDSETKEKDLEAEECTEKCEEENEEQIMSWRMPAINRERENIEEQDEEEVQGEVAVEEEVQCQIRERQKCPIMKKGERIRASLKETGEREEWMILSLGGKRSSKKWCDSYNAQNLDSGRRKWINLREYENIEKIADEEEILLGFEDEEILQAKRKELQSWKENEVFEEVPEEGQRKMSMRWIITEKMKEGKRICKARLVARGFEENYKKMQTDAPTCSPESLKLCLSIMMIRGWECQSLDVKTAYLQGNEIKREIYIDPPRETGIDAIWRLKKTIYGLKDAARAWYEKVKEVIEELGGIKSKYDPVIFYWHNEKNELIGILCSHVDDFCFGGTVKFNEGIISKLAEKLKVGEREKKEFKYIGVKISQEKETLWLDQESYVRSIQIPEVKRFRIERRLTDSELKEYRSLVGQINWLAQQTRPDLAYEVSDLSAGFQEAFTKDMRRVVKVANKSKEGEKKVKMEKLTGDGVFWEVYTDASFGNEGEGKSQIGYIISLKDDEGKRCPIQWKSMKAKRVAKSTLEAEALSLGEGAEAGVYLNKIWEEINGRKIPVRIKTDCRTLEKALKSHSLVKSKRLRIDVAAIKEMLKMGEVEEIEWVETKQQVADILTKRGVARGNIEFYVFGNGEEQERKERRRV